MLGHSVAAARRKVLSRASIEIPAGNSVFLAIQFSKLRIS
jgi:hypothetical protein